MDDHSPRTTAETARNVARQAEKVSESAEHMEVSAGAVEASALELTDSADRRTVLAADRTVLAAERTYAAWIRTGLAALASGIGARALLEDRLPRLLTASVGGVMIAFAVFCFVAAVWRQLRPLKAPPHPDTDRLPPAVLVGFSGLLCLISAAALLELLFGRL
jgi:putative membrane protein